MLSKCANPDCSAAFRFFHEGRLFTVVGGAGEVRGDSWGEAVRPVERYWLCRDCSRSLTIAVEQGRAVIRRLPRSAPVPHCQPRMSIA